MISGKFARTPAVAHLRTLALTLVRDLVALRRCMRAGHGLASWGRSVAALEGTMSSTNADESETADLSATLERPIFNRTLGKEVGNGLLDYEVYVKTSALFALQTSRGDLCVPEEHLFQVVHQSQELWLKAIAFEVVALVDALGAQRLHEACALLDRIVVIQQCLASEMRILQTVTPETFLEIRRNLGSGSGLESAESAFDGLLVRSAVGLLDLYRLREPHESHEGLKRVAELLVDWDEAFQTWLVAHFHLVRRTLGVHRKVLALDGFPTQALAPRMTKPLFPKLWDARVELTQAWTREGGHAPGAERGPETNTPAPAAAPRATDRVPAP
jgi:tryptophan 2,3-dioxygenase